MSSFMTKHGGSEEPAPPSVRSNLVIIEYNHSIIVSAHV